MIGFNDIVILIWAALILFLVFWFFQKYVIRWIKNDRIHDALEFYIPVMRNTVWVLFIIDLLYEVILLNYQSSWVKGIMACGMFGIIIAFVWGIIRDFIQGIIFKFQKGNIIGQRIKLDDFSGEIVQMKNTKLDIQLENGEIIQYPYSKLTSKVVTKPTIARHLKSCSFSISVPYGTHLEKTKEQITRYMLNIPWVISGMKMKIEVIDQNLEEINLKIIVYTIDEKYISKIKQEVDSLVLT